MTALFLVPSGEFDIDEFDPGANAVDYGHVVAVTEDVTSGPAYWGLFEDNQHFVGLFTSGDHANDIGLFMADNYHDMVG